MTARAVEAAKANDPEARRRASAAVLLHVSAAVAEVVDVAALERLVEALDQVVTLPGLVPPAAHRLRAAAVELLQDLDGRGVSA